MALRMTSAHFRNEFQQSVLLQREVYRYTYELMVQMTRTAACNRFHRVEARLARWLLMSRDACDRINFIQRRIFLAICWVCGGLASPTPPAPCANAS
jgi:hypothetical protein